jgi:cytochrome b subunit of formate dehydrogenase
MNENESMTENPTDQENTKRGRSVSISVKILVVTLGTTIMVLLVSGIVSFIMSRDAIEDKIFNQMTSLREIKGQQIESYIDRISQQIVTLSDNPATIDAMSTLKRRVRFAGCPSMNNVR